MNMTIGEVYARMSSWIESLPAWVLLAAFAAFFLVVGFGGAINGQYTTKEKSQS